MFGKSCPHWHALGAVGLCFLCAASPMADGHDDHSHERDPADGGAPIPQFAMSGVSVSVSFSLAEVSVVSVRLPKD